MYRQRLTVALASLAAAAVLQGLSAVWSLGLADAQIQRGRVASDIQLGFAELAGNKQRLRIWLVQRQLDEQQGGDGDTTTRDRLLLAMQADLLGLRDKALRAAALDDSPAARQHQVQRHDALTVLESTVRDLALALRQADTPASAAGARQALDAAALLFDRFNGRDLTRLLSDSVAREAQAVRDKRLAADAALRWMRGLWLGSAATLALAALLLGAYFTRALRKPLDDLASGAQALQRGELGHRIPLSGRDEFAAVAQGMNAMAAELTLHRQREAQAREGLESQVQARTAELQQALDALRQADVQRRQLFADISHELRTPTTVIRGEAEVSLRGAIKPVDEYRAALQRIVDTARQLGLVIDDLLTMARSDVDALALNRAPLDARAPLHDAVAQATALAHDHGVQLQVLSWPAEPQALVGDAQRLRQLGLVLLDNAVRYSRPGGLVRVQAQLLPGSAPMLVFEVMDDGIGIPADELPHVFERNFRGRQARSHRADGSGLGLAIARTLARAHGGDITIDSPPGHGTCVTLRLPLSAPFSGAPSP
jgi:two-component system, OmpR family, sensor kinase